MTHPTPSSPAWRLRAVLGVLAALLVVMAWGLYTLGNSGVVDGGPFALVWPALMATAAATTAGWAAVPTSRWFYATSGTTAVAAFASRATASALSASIDNPGAVVAGAAWTALTILTWLAWQANPPAVQRHGR